jgi:mannosyltransferase OCH1-like enzyme
MIPKTIHYCWFGNNPKSKEILTCIESWKKTCPDFVIKEWNETNIDIQGNPFMRKMYQERKWAFVADYARLLTLEKEGGIYLDTDMLLLKSISPLLTSSCVLGEEEPGIISAGMIAAEKSHPFITSCKTIYDTSTTLVTIPIALTEVYKNYNNKKELSVLPFETFYPFTQATISKYHGQNLSEKTYGVHLWHYSWGHPLNKFFKKIGIYYFGKKITEILGIKKIIKKILGFV